MSARPRIFMRNKTPVRNKNHDGNLRLTKSRLACSWLATLAPFYLRQGRRANVVVQRCRLSYSCALLCVELRDSLQVWNRPRYHPGFGGDEDKGYWWIDTVSRSGIIDDGRSDPERGETRFHVDRCADCWPTDHRVVMWINFCSTRTSYTATRPTAVTAVIDVDIRCITTVAWAGPTPTSYKLCGRHAETYFSRITHHFTNHHVRRLLIF